MENCLVKQKLEKLVKQKNWLNGKLVKWKNQSNGKLG